jgi:hypothetical protein
MVLTNAFLFRESSNSTGEYAILLIPMGTNQTNASLHFGLQNYSSVTAREIGVITSIDRVLKPNGGTKWVINAISETNPQTTSLMFDLPQPVRGGGNGVPLPPLGFNLSMTNGYSVVGGVAFFITAEDMPPVKVVMLLGSIDLRAGPSPRLIHAPLPTPKLIQQRFYFAFPATNNNRPQTPN